MSVIELFVLVCALALFLTIGFVVGKRLGSFKANRFWEGQVAGIRKDAALRSRSVLQGHFSEQLAPFMPGFGYHPGEARFLGKPVDLIVFKGLDQKRIEEVVFVEVKTGKSRLSDVERSLRHCIESGKVSYEVYKPQE